MAAPVDIEQAHELRRYLHEQVGVDDPRAKAPSSQTSPFASILPKTSVLANAFATVVELAVARLGVLGALAVLTDGRKQHLLAACQTRRDAEEEVEVSVNWFSESQTDNYIWLWLAQQVVGAHTNRHSTDRASFSIDGLDENPRTAKLSCVTGIPHLKRYIAVPIVTAHDAVIGYIAVVDNRVREATNIRDINFLATLASRCMRQLESARERYMRARWFKMNEGLQNLIKEPKLNPLNNEPAFRPEDHYNHSAMHRSSSQSPKSTEGENELKQRVQLSTAESSMQDQSHRAAVSEADMAKEEVRTKQNLSAQAGGGGTEADKRPGMDQRAKNERRSESIYRKTFRRATEILTAGLNVDGALFMDGLVGFHGTLMPDAELVQELDTQSEQRPPRGMSSLSRFEAFDEEEQTQPPRAGGIDDFRAQPAKRIYTSADYQKNVLITHPAEILGMSVRHGPRPDTILLSPTTYGVPKFDEGYLQDFMERHMHGRIWYFDSGGPSFFVKEDRLVPDGNNEDTKRLRSIFPEARQLIFLVLTDPVAHKNISGFFAWTSEDVPIYTDTADLPYLRDFLHMVESDISRIDTIAAMKQQESFVASVSHELRTPLHGILGAAQLIKETPINSFQESLVETINSCGSTLHETLTSVLSYAKINQFERRDSKPGPNTRQESPWALAGKPVDAESERDYHGMLVGVNIVSLCEEVISVIEASRSYLQSSQGTHVSLDAEYREHWNFITEPGALRRVALNIVGNAMKYTGQGFVKLSIRAKDLTAEKAKVSVANSGRPTKIIVISCSDSGRGMSKDFVENHLFVPFSQENPVSSTGVGLGMSIVKSLVTILGGEIHVSSAIGQGTIIEVRIPMIVGSSDPGFLSSADLAFERNLQKLRQRKLGVMIHGFKPEASEDLRKYLVDWFRCGIMDIDADEEPDVLIANEGDATITHKFLEKTPRYRTRGVLLSITPARLTKALVMTEAHGIWERTSRPLGPGQFAKALVTCLQKLDALHADGPPSNQQTTEVKDTGRISGIADMTPDSIAQLPNDLNGFMQNTTRQVAPDLTSMEISDSTVVPEPVEQPSMSNKPSPTPNVLIVEDNAINLKLLTTFVRKGGYHSLHTATNGAIAVEQVQESASGFDVIFMDLSMPVMDGFEATRRIREQEVKVKETDSLRKRATIVALTGLASQKDEEEAFKAGVDMFVTKPVKFGKLNEILMMWKLDKAREERDDGEDERKGNTPSIQAVGEEK
ncbi:hypothetical protein BDV96DRAFT_594074 [Lophiotrema nucula]|uniref:Uncharacterized protein n=1 Tax=Lophiotrema nucula TaxID=690887 RepID=A0A6A5ZR46_9PLEO|nr:hypothetical protein BDV96DRAFT_594074 [Lophiotrema nucula]